MQSLICFFIDFYKVALTGAPDYPRLFRGCGRGTVFDNKDQEVK